MKKQAIEEPKKKPLRLRIKHAYIDLKERFMGAIIIAICLSALWIIMRYVEVKYNLSFYYAIKEIPNLHPWLGQLWYEIQNRTPKGIFMFYSLGSIFIFPFPLEMVFLALLKSGKPFMELMPIIFAGIFIGHNLNYFLGRGLGFLLKNSIKKKTRKKINYFLTRYGVVSIFIFNAGPFPSQIFNFCVGLFKYPYHKWLITFIIGQIANYLILYFVYLSFLK